ncbi:glucosyl transferase [Dyadobacter beijingensis]|uniref:Glucosyl transferase n=1 Tax=Dyadobacter beijingensis TaxID=365489 RepID=A0ABQ2HQ69_9BACT|nr:glycosyltransferase [Dyadobacter beijingensis]GGM86331.1 glucosyl transferase [Dyadobacter beijingensis]
MIFVTIGTQAPFDRLIKAIDEIAPQLNGERVVAQVFESSYQVKNLETVGFLSPDEFNTYFDEARLVVAHAGMGTIISALTQAKPLLILPRLASMGEHRNDHQIATAKKMQDLGYVQVAFDEQELVSKLLKMSAGANGSAASPQIRKVASDTLISSVRGYIFSNK